jgi:hypothetical protein
MRFVSLIVCVLLLSACAHRPSYNYSSENAVIDGRTYRLERVESYLRTSGPPGVRWRAPETNGRPDPQLAASVQQELSRSLPELAIAQADDADFALTIVLRDYACLDHCQTDPNHWFWFVRVIPRDPRQPEIQIDRFYTTKSKDVVSREIAHAVARVVRRRSA